MNDDIDRLLFGACAAVCLVLLATLITLWRNSRQIDAQAAEIAQQDTKIEQLQQNRRTLITRLDDLARQLGTARGERDLARDTVRELLAAREAGFRWPQTRPMPMPPDVDDTLADEFTAIMERREWPQWPGGRAAS